ncbi:transcription cofactor vestigial-like protein 4 isoform X2 [Acanthaster planci]|uniref:Transcription cofactor vestigial-like protein 4 isoform X2 n=1 Tax=Acanthaster planci TaxID=133434 RepID=A0A8B7Z0P1_ACAPL|nr:transcription cofactor vestigial-like protein 4 isoform X2 [Acanthaster planci]
METPLDVLSRAATMVETDRPAGSNAALHSEDLRSEVSKELPSRINRQRRSTERRELSQVLRFDDLHNVGNRSAAATMMDDTAAAVSTRCTGTQTEITTMRLEDHDAGVPDVNPALPTPSSSYLTPSPTLLPTPSGSGKETQQVRPSVITCAPSQPREGSIREGLCNTNNPMYGKTNGYTSSTSTHSTNCHRREISLGVCDPVIEEHFRRSLGKDYKENYGASKSASSTEGVVTMITGSVDDHFAKALGDKWPQIKNVMEPSSQSPPSSPRLVHPTSVMST